MKSESLTSEHAHALVKVDTSLGSNEVEGDEVDRLGRFDVDISHKLVAVDDLSLVVSGVTNNEEVVHASLSLNVSQERIDIVLEE